MTISLQSAIGHDLDLALSIQWNLDPLVDRSLTDPERAGQSCLSPKIIDGILLFHGAESMAYRTKQGKDTIPSFSYAQGMERRTITDRINEVILESKRKPAEIARAIGMSKQAMNDWTEGRTKNPRNENLLDFADEMGVELRWLISERGPKQAKRDPPKVERAACLMRTMPEHQLEHLVEFLESSSKAA